MKGRIELQSSFTDFMLVSSMLIDVELLISVCLSMSVCNTADFRKLNIIPLRNDSAQHSTALCNSKTQQK